MMMSGPRETTPKRSEERYNLLLRVASLYYEDQLTQHEISTRLGYSRSAISRLLGEAREAGIVEIRVHHPLTRNHELEQALRERFHLPQALVLASGGLPYAKMLRRLGELAAQMLNDLVREDSVLGVAWGSSLYEVASALRPPRYPDVLVLQMIGALGTADPQIDGPELVRLLAQQYGGRYLTLPAPLIVDSPEVRNALMADRRVAEVLERARQASLALVGIGSVDPALSSMLRAGYLSLDELNEAARQGAVGDVCAIHFDIKGRVLDIPLAERIVGIPEDALRQIPLVVGVAGGEVKAPAILGALRARLINTLVTDDSAVRKLLKLAAG